MAHSTVLPLPPVWASADHIERPLMTPDEILRLTPARKEGHAESERIVAPGQMLVFVSGHYPILGTQMFYFSDPVLAKRAEIAPPIEFSSLVSNGIVQQPALDRTANVMSRPEVVSGGNGSCGTYASPMEKGFIEQLELDKRRLIQSQER